MGQLVFQATLGGAVNLIGPNTASTINFTLPSADGTNGQFLSTNGSGTLSFATVTSSQWTTSGSNIYYNTGSVFINGTSGTSKLAVANNTSDGTSNTRQYAVFGTATTYLDSDAANLWGSGLGEFQIQNGTATRPAMLSMGGSVNTDEGMGVINFFRSGNDDSYRSRVQIAGVVGSTGTAGRHGGYLEIRIAADGQSDPATNFRLNPSGTVILKGGTTSADGTGITFPATQSASSNANTLDDYEEGTWTPSLTTTSGSLTTVSVGTGYYTKVGRMVTITCSPTIVTNGTGAGALLIDGLPFPQTANGFAGASRNDGNGNVFGINANTGTQLYIQKYDGTYPGGNGYGFSISISYFV